MTDQSQPGKPDRRRRYHVSGIDDLGDIHTFSTDDRDRADEIRTIMGEDLKNVELEERPKRRPQSRSLPAARA